MLKTVLAMAYMQGFVGALQIRLQCLSCSVHPVPSLKTQHQQVSVSSEGNIFDGFAHYTNWRRLFTSVTAWNTNAEPLKNGLLLSSPAKDMT